MSPTDSAYEFGSFRLEPSEHRLLCADRPVLLSPKMFETLCVLVERRGSLVTKEDLMKAVWPDTIVEEANLTVTISALRKALGCSPDHRTIETVSRFGYRFVAEVRCLRAEPALDADALPNESQVPVAATADARILSVRPLAGRRPALWTLAGLVLVLAGVLSIVARARLAGNGAPALRVSPLTSLSGDVGTPAFSPDGRHIAFTWCGERADNTDIYVKPLEATTPLRLTNAPGFDCCPAWSPDGQSIAFLSGTSADDTAVFVVASAGGVPRKLAPVSADPRLGLAWSPDGEHLAYFDRSKRDELPRIHLLSTATLACRPLTPPVTTTDRRPTFSPDGRYLAFIRTDEGSGQASICVVVLGTGELRTLITVPAWIRSIAWLDERMIVFARAGAPMLWSLSIDDRVPKQVAVPEEEPSSITTTPELGRLAYVREVYDADLWRTELVGPRGPARAPERIESSTRLEAMPRFSPDGRRLVFRSDRSGHPEIWTSDPDGSRPVQLTDRRRPLTGCPTWSPDGRFIAFSSTTSDIDWKWRIHIIPSEGGVPRRLVDWPASQGAMTWSRDGRWIYFAADHDGRWDIFKTPADGGSAVQVTSAGGSRAFESADGQWLYFTKLEMPGVWRMPIGGGAETRVLDAVEPALYAYWEVVDDGMYFVRKTGTIGGAIEFFELAMNRTHHVTSIRGELDWSDGGLTVSPDRRWIVYSQVARRSSEIVLVENFR